MTPLGNWKFQHVPRIPQKIEAVLVFIGQGRFLSIRKANQLALLTR
jgi:hypothetical protein